MVRPNASPIREQAANSNFQLMRLWPGNDVSSCPGRGAVFLIHRRVDRGFQKEVTMFERIKGAL
jgi:hypothetical protein